jgi:hypothetical protein
LTGDIAASEATLRRAMTLSGSGEDPLIDAEIAYEIGCTWAARGQTDAARDAWTRALDTFERIGAREWVTRARDRLAETAARE